MKIFDRIRYNRVVRALFILIPFVIGFVGYYFYYSEVGSVTVPFLSALYSAVRLFGFSFDAAATDRVPLWTYILLEIARYWAAVLTGSALFKIIKPYLVDLLTAIKAHSRKSIVLHGSPCITSVMKNHMQGYKVIEQNDSLQRFKSNLHVIAFEQDADALQFLEKNYNALVHSPLDHQSTIYLCTHSSDYNLASDAIVQISCVAKNCARLFWDRYYIKRFSDKCAQNKHTVSPSKAKIVLIGFDTYGQALLDQALLVNVFPKGTAGIEYHIFGDGKNYIKKHPMLSKIVSFDENVPFDTDCIQFHIEKDYYDCCDLLTQAERIIICGDDDMENCFVFSQLCKMTAGLPDIFIRAKNSQVVSSLYQDRIAPQGGDYLFNVQIHVFGTDDELYTEDVIINKSLEKNAREIHRWYKIHTGSVEWEDIGTIKQYSNYAAADHFPVKVRQIMEDDVYPNAIIMSSIKKELPEIIKDTRRLDVLLEMEHIRWCRYYYLLGWQYAAQKDENKRLHNCLKDFDQLDESTKRNDLYAYYAICDVETDSPILP